MSMFRFVLLAAVCTFGVALSACSGTSRTGTSDTSTFPDDYRRVVSPSFPVEDQTGTPIANPFYGGFNTPRPQFVDVDGDEDSDLFVQEEAGELSFFEHVTEDDSSRLVWRTDHYRGLEIGEWFRFADLDQDGLPDLLTEEPYSYLRVYRNVGKATDPQFELFVDTLKSADGTPIFSDRQNIPNVTDLDCNGQLDLFIGRLDGTITRYEAVGDSAGIPRFAHVTGNFEGIKIVRQVGGSMHGANTLTFADINDDGAPDLFWGDFFEPGLLLIENTGSCPSPDLTGEPRSFPYSNPLSTSGYNAPALTDWTGNGQLDLFVGVLGGAHDANSSLSENVYFYEQTNSGFQLRTRQFVGGIDVGSESTVAMGDIDNDGTLDALVANKIDPDRGETSMVYRFENTGSVDAPRYRRGAPLDLPETYHYAPALGDLTDDGTPDLILGTWKGRLAYYRNQGDGTFDSVDEAIAELPSGSNAVPALGDLDGDGLMDLVVGASGGSLHAYQNTGTPTDPSFSEMSDLLSGIEVGSRSAPALHDVDGDGDLDLLVGSKDDLLLIQNEGTPDAPDFEGEATPLELEGVPSLSVPAMGDLNGDGSPELLLGGEQGGLVLFQAPSSKE